MGTAKNQIHKPYVRERGAIKTRFTTKDKKEILP
jgi:hypothetical protein